MNVQTCIKERTHSIVLRAYRKPHGLSWMSGVFILFIILGFGLTGCQLPREQKGELVESGIPSQGGVSVSQSGPLHSGEKLFCQHCLECHSLEGEGGSTAPDLTAYGSKQWLIGLIQNPNAPKYYGNTKLDKMPEYDYLEEEVLSNLADFLLAQADEGKEIDPVLKEIGEMIFEENECYSCHSYGGKGGSIAPKLDNFASDKWLRGLIEDAGQEALFGFRNEMPAFKDKLSKQEIDNLVCFLRSLRKKVD